MEAEPQQTAEACLFTGGGGSPQEQWYGIRDPARIIHVFQRPRSLCRVSVTWGLSCSGAPPRLTSTVSSLAHIASAAA